MYMKYKYTTFNKYQWRTEDIWGQMIKIECNEQNVKNCPESLLWYVDSSLHNFKSQSLWFLSHCNPKFMISCSGKTLKKARNWNVIVYHWIIVILCLLHPSSRRSKFHVWVINLLYHITDTGSYEPLVDNCWINLLKD